METTVSNGKFCPEDIDYLCAELERQRWVRTATTEDGATYMSPGGNWVAALGSAGVTWVHKGAPSDRLSGRCSVQTVMNQIDRIDDPVPTFGEWGGVFRQAGWQPFASKGASGYKSPDGRWVAWFTANSVDWYGGRDCNPRWSAVSVEDVRERIVILGKLASVSDADMDTAAFGLLRDFVNTATPDRLQNVDPVLLAWVVARD